MLNTKSLKETRNLKTHTDSFSLESQNTKIKHIKYRI